MIEFVTPSAGQGEPGFATAALANGYAFVVVNALDPDTNQRVESAKTVADETRICLERLQDILAAKGLSLRDVIKANGFLASNDDRVEFWTAYKEIFEPGPYPARCTYAAGLPGDCRVQLDVVAVAR